MLQTKQIKLNRRVVFESVSTETPFHRVPKPFFENESCFMFVKKGGFNFRTPLKNIALTPENALLAKCGNYYLEKSTSAHEEDSPLELFGVFFYPEMVKAFFPSELSLESFEVTDFDVTEIDPHPIFSTYVDSLAHLFENPHLADDDLVRIKLKEIMLLLYKTGVFPSLGSFLKSLFHPFEYQFKEIIEANILSDLTLEELASMCHMSLSTFKRRFSEYFDVPPRTYLLQKKLQTAKELVQMHDQPIAKIALACGFTSTSGFIRAYNKAYGVSPSQERLNQK
ncbi:helix-turn-helix domain-containing protein [Muricauda sp. JGD-17]|uniref:Helix-turn-helix domain-containing protein n=2 Tax=Flagellimonas ochracea TaxID=2696472 RepID=A0A964TBE3_9FLAO|nr:helix-turn-helix domain-containing protein [Allomuricauda ochracea]